MVLVVSAITDIVALSVYFDYVAGVQGTPIGKFTAAYSFFLRGKNKPAYKIRAYLCEPKSSHQRCMYVCFTATLCFQGCIKIPVVVVLSVCTA